MQKFWLNSLLFSPAVLGALMIFAVPIASAETPEPSAPTNDSTSLAQLTSVSQLSDVRPTDWAFQALQSLVERYGCIAGYPNKTFLGNRALTRYEFAAGLNACLDQVNQLIAAATTELVTKEDLATLQKLQEEYAAELQSIRGQVDALEARTATLEAQQFSTTTKLRGEVIFALAGVFGDTRALNSDQVRSNAARTNLNDNFIFADRVRLNLDSSFTGKDRLRVRLQARNITSFNAAVTGTNQTRLGFDGDSTNNVSASVITYRLPLGDSTLVNIGAYGMEFIDELPNFNRGFDSSGSGALSRFGRYNTIYRSVDSGAGVIVNHKLNDAITLSAGYIVPDNNANDPANNRGLFNGSYTALGQINFQPTPQLGIGFTYANSYYSGGAVTGGSGVAVSGSTGTTFANDPFNGARTSSNSYSVAGTYRFSPQFTIAAWGGYTEATAENTISGATKGNTAEIWNWAVQLGFPDFGGEGNFAGIVFGAPPYAASNQYVSGTNRRTDSNVSYHLEAFYKYKLNDNIAVTPGFITIFDPEGNSSNPTSYVGVVRTTFTF
ncbi:iron uptake porin [Calothrix sp. PCC 7507]|uniref:iron uptake porin n=1 Tax=Calothrix sp. PCC 7507 TaxID=99598 RepID=UPI00029EF176|nr:iron uptake porin [Calothrix sp. PCC 7507]AFY34817.1 cyanobacterial porin [Calothrix sp. PCC 7507]